MKRQKIKRYRFSVTQNTRRRRAARPLKAVGVVLVCLCLLTGAVFGIYKAIQSKTTGWHGEGLHRYYISPTTGTRAQGLYEINYKLYYFGSNNFLKVGWIEENGYVGYANADGELTQGEAKIDGKYYYFQPETGQLYTGWIMLDGVQYCFDETGHPRTGTYQEDGKVWELDSDGRVKNRLNGWKKTDGVLKYYDNSGAPAQGWTEIDGKDYFFVDGVSQAGWVETDAGTRYLDGNGNQMTEWCVIDGQPYAFGTNGEPKQGWDHSHEKSYYFINGVSQSGTFGEGALSNNLNGSGSVQPVGDQAPEDDLAEDAEGEPPEEELLEKVRGMNRRRQFQMPKDHKAVYGDRLILGQYHCLTIQLGQKRTKKAILYLFGGGMIVGPDQGDIKTARDFAVRSGSDCWFPYYPLCTDHCITETYEMVLQCYREMTECYGAEHISLVGFSSGGALAVGLPLHLNALNRPTGMPRQVIAVSPGSIPSSQKERAEMQALNSRDVMVDAAFMETDRKIMTKGQPVPAYMLSGPKGDFTGLPPVHFYYGGDEVLSVVAESFADACKAANVPYTMTIAPGMCHCYAMVEWFPEGRQAREEIIGLLR